MKNISISANNVNIEAYSRLYVSLNMDIEESELSDLLNEMKIEDIVYFWKIKGIKSRNHELRTT